MENNQDQTLLQEVVYKAPTQDTTSTSLKPETRHATSSFLYLAVLIANLIAFCTGIAFGWPSPVLPKLISDVNPLGRKVTSSEESWIAGLPCLGGIFGPLFAGAIADRIGRKKTLLLFSVPMVISFLITAYAETVLLYYIARLLVGFGAASTFTVLPLYLGEISEDHNRGTIGCSLGMFISFGLLFSFGVGPFLTIQNFCLACVVPLVIFIPVFAIWIPESPIYLASTNKDGELEASLTKLRKKSFASIQKEVSDISKIVLEETQNKGGVGDLFKMRGLRKGLIITLGLVTLQQFAGINAVLSYMQQIFDATGSAMRPEISTIIVGVIQILTTITTSFLVDRLGRRLLLLTSVFGSCVSIITLGLYFFLKDREYKVDTISWLPVSSLIVYIVAFNIGLGPLPWAVMAELFPSNVRSAAATITSVTCFIGAFIITCAFPILKETLGLANSFWSFGLVCLAGTLFIYVILPETKGKSLQEIQRLLEGNKS